MYFIIKKYLIMSGVLGAVLTGAALIWRKSGALFLLLFLCFSILSAWRAFKRMQTYTDKVMIQVDNTILGLIEGRREQYFSPNEDSLLGKFQTHIIQLYEILNARKEQETNFRLQIGSSVSNLVHQFNTPITNIKLYCGFLQDERLSEEEYRHFIENITSQAEKLRFLGEGFSKISRMETGIIALKPSISLILPCLLKAIDEVSASAAEHDNVIVLSGEQKLCAKLDAKWTEEVFYNLLDNAVKYSETGTEILVEMVSYELFVRINVINEGILIPKDEYSKIFKRFYRSVEVKDLQGVGLGLYLAREILRGQGGYIKTGITQNGRTNFSVYLSKV